MVALPDGPMSYVCRQCGEAHEGLPDLVLDEPSYAHEIPPEERAQRVRLDDDLCVVDGEHYFVRGVIEIPVHGQADAFGIGAWVTQKKENFQTYVDNFNSPEIGPFFGWLSNEFSFKGQSTLHLKTMAHFRGAGRRPVIQLEATDHPLAVAQRDGMDLDEAWAVVHERLGPAAT